MFRRLLLGVVCSALVVPASANAAQVAIAIPPAPVPEDAAFALTVSGVSDPGEYQDVAVRIRPAGGVPCAALPKDDAGTRVLDENLGTLGGPFTKMPTYTPDVAGSYLVCAWMTGASSSDLRAGPISATVAVRLPTLALTLGAPKTIRPRGTLPVALDYTAEVQRDLVVALGQAGDCGVSSRALRDATSNYVEAFSDRVSGTGHADRTVTVPAASGTYRLCGYFYTDSNDSSGTPQLVVAGPTIKVAIPTVRCATVGGRRRITEVRATGPSCGAARSVARRWGAPRKSPRIVGTYTCRRGPSRHVTCRSETSGKVTFRYRR